MKCLLVCLLLLFVSGVLSQAANPENDSHKDSFLNSQYSQYVIDVKISTLGQQKASDDIELNPSESWDDECLCVTLIPNAPVSELPTRWEGLRVFYNFPGKKASDGNSEDGGFVVCATDLKTCFDGTEVARTGNNCEFVCPPGSIPTGGINETKAWQALSDFLPLIVNNPNYLYSFAIQLQGAASYVDLEKVHLTENETFEDYCIVIGSSLSSFGVGLPLVFENVRVFYHYDSACYDCNSDDVPSRSSSIATFYYLITIFFFSAVGGCLCWTRRRRYLNQQKNNEFQRLPTFEIQSQSVQTEDLYPQQAYEQSQIQAQTKGPVYPVPVMSIPQMPVVVIHDGVQYAVMPQYFYAPPPAFPPMVPNDNSK